MQGNSIIEKASQLGLNTGDGSTSLDNLRTIASQVGLHDFNSEGDIGKLESALDSKLSEVDNSSDAIEGDNESLNAAPIGNQKLGQKQYDQAKKDGVYDSNHYKAKQQELDKKAEDLNQERQKDWKMKKGETGPAKEDGSNTVRKSKMNRVMDNLNYAKAKKNAITNKVNGALADVYDKTHPVEHVKNEIKKNVNDQVNKVKDKVKKPINDAKNKAKNKTKTAIKAAGKKMAAFIAANPWILLIIGGVFLLAVIIIVVIAGASSSGGYYSQECNFNASTVNLTTCISGIIEEGVEPEVTTLDLKDYVLGTTYELIKDRDFTDSQIKAVMVIVKTNALSYGSYDNSTKVLELDTCSYEYSDITANNEYERYDELYTEIENYLYISSSYNTSIDVLTSSNALELNSQVLNEISENSDNFNIILNNLYEPNSEEANEIVYTSNLFIGDSRIEEMKNYGIVDSSKVIYGRGYGYDWFVGDGEFNAGNTNSLDGGIAGAIKKMKSNTNYNVIIWLGINDLNYKTADIYFDKYYELAKDEWSNYNVYIVKVGPVRDDVEAITNDRINDFNARMQSLINASNLNNLRFVDINYNVSDYDESGIHYGSSDYKKIYSDIMKYVGVNNSVSREYQLYNLDDHCEYIYVDDENSSNGCEEMSISSTVLSRDEFIAKLESYYGSSTTSYGTDFRDNAGTIYDLATRNGINPELIVVRADIEGYSPVSMGFGTYYNYWGIGCYNNQPLSKCISYDTFDDGVLGFINNVSSYDSLSSMMKKYAYIGDYWYNPGNAGSGGCYYYPYIKKYMSASRANEIEPYCATGNTCNGEECLKTNDEDQLAYSMYQVEIMASKRNSIFNITSDFCSGYSQNCTLFSQGDSRWKDIKLGNSNSTMGSSGCAVTSIAIGISCSGTELAVANFDAGKLLNTLNAGSCFTSSGAIMWGCSAIRNIAPNVSLYTTESLSSKTDEYKINAINSYNTADKFVLVHFENNEHPRGHYVVVTSINGNTISAKDPAGGKMSNVNVKYVDQLVVYSAK